MINKLVRKIIQVDINKRIKWEEYFNDNFFIYNNNNNLNIYKSIKITNLKSPLLKIIFSFLNEKKKLNIIINNKNLQNKFKVNIENYKYTSIKYKIGERNGKGMEFLKNYDIMIFSYLKENI